MMNEWIISSSVLIAAVLLVRFLLRGRISLRLQYGLWAVVLLRLLLPIQVFTSDFGTGSIAGQVDIAEPVRQVYASANEDRYEREYDEAYRRAVARYEAANQSYDPIVLEKTARELTQADLELDLTNMLHHVWLAGMVGMACVIGACNLHLSIQLKRRRWAVELPESLLRVYITEAVPTPCIFGFFRPAIYLTPEAAKDEQVRAHVLEHELTHYRHGDHIWSVLRSLCLVLHWYNPLVWIAAKISRADAELACDEGALEKLGESQRFDYGRTLIGLTCSAPISELILTATTMTGSSGSIRERIKLLMARPRNTVLTVTALILMVALIVGCTFAGAPESTPGATTPPETTAAPGTTAPAESGVPGVDNDMSYHGQELPIPENPISGDGLLTYPGIEWFMTEDQVLAALGLTHRDVLGAQYTREDGMRAACVTVQHTEGFGVPLVLDLTFRSYWEGTEPVLTEIYGHFVEEADFDTILRFYADALGETDAKINPGIEERWDSDLLLRDLVGREGYALLDRCAAEALNVPASYVQWLNNGTPEISWFTVLPEPGGPAWIRDPVEEITALFSADGSPWYLAALAAPYANDYSFDAAVFFSAGRSDTVTLEDAESALVQAVYGKEGLDHVVFSLHGPMMDRTLEQYVGTDTSFLDMTEFLFCPETEAYILVREEVPQRRIPEILSVDLLAADQARMIYRFYGEEQTYCATLIKGETWKVYSNHLLLSVPQGARALTAEEIAQVRASFTPSIYHADTGANYGNPLACFTHSMYADVSEMTKFDFLSYYPPILEEPTRAEFELLKEQYPDYFAGWTWENLPLPINRFDADALDDFMMEYAGIPFSDLPDGRWAHYLKETDSYYNYTSDAGLLGFPCGGGWVYDGGAMLYTDFAPQNSVLILTEHDGAYRIQAHLPALIAE